MLLDHHLIYRQKRLKVLATKILFKLGVTYFTLIHNPRRDVTWYGAFLNSLDMFNMAHLRRVIYFPQKHTSSLERENDEKKEKIFF